MRYRIRFGSRVMRKLSHMDENRQPVLMEGTVTYVHPKYGWYLVEFVLPNGNTIRETYYKHEDRGAW